MLRQRSPSVLYRRLRCFFTAAAADSRNPEDEGDWSYSPEWWRSDPNDAEGHTVFRRHSDQGNGVVSVVAYPSSRPAPEQWPAVENWLQRRYASVHPELDHGERFKIFGYQWRLLHFNENTRQSTVKVMAAYRTSDPTSLYLMQQPHCLAVPYIRSMVSAGLTTLVSSGYDLSQAVTGERPLNVLCIGHGGGSLPLFLASKIKGATVDIVEIDPLVITASTQAMGFPSSAVVNPSEKTNSAVDDVLWEKLRRRLFLRLSDAEDFVLRKKSPSLGTYDLIFMDAYDGDDIFPRKLWCGPFLEALRSILDPVHGTVVVNLHSDFDPDPDPNGGIGGMPILSMGGYVSRVARAYKEHIGGVSFTFSVPFLCNITLVACSGGFPRKRSITETLVAAATPVESALGLPFSCLEYIRRGLVVVTGK